MHSLSCPVNKNEAEETQIQLKGSIKRILLLGDTYAGMSLWEYKTGAKSRFLMQAFAAFEDTYGKHLFTEGLNALHCEFLGMKPRKTGP